MGGLYRRRTVGPYARLLKSRRELLPVTARSERVVGLGE